MTGFHRAIIAGLIILLTVTASVPQAMALTAKEEEEMSREFLKVVFDRYEIIDDPLITEYLNELGEKILDRMPPQPFVFHFYVVKEDVYNAFAGPAGHIFINSGLFTALDSEEELAGILGHEICHVTSRHISQMIARSKTTNLATLAGVAAGVLLGVSGAGTAGSAVTVGSIAAGQSAQLAYSRENEMQADQLALGYLADAGYSGTGLLDSLKKIRSKTWFSSEQIPTYLLTHPAVEDRLTYISTWVDSHETDPWTTPPEQNDQFSLVKTTLSARYGGEEETLKAFAAELKQRPDDFFLQYGYGIVLARTGDRKEAIQYLQAALKQKPFSTSAVQELGRVYFQDGQYEKASAMLASASRSGSFDPATQLLQGRSQLKLGHYSQATTTLENIIKQRPDYTPAYYYLGDAYGKQELRGNAHYYLGKYYRQRGDVKNATFHLKTALDHLTDPALVRETERMLGTDLKAAAKKKKKD